MLSLLRLPACSTAELQVKLCLRHEHNLHSMCLSSQGSSGYAGCNVADRERTSCYGEIRKDWKICTCMGCNQYINLQHSAVSGITVN